MRSPLSRRDILTGLAGLPLAGLCPAKQPNTSGRGRIDVHHHFIPEEFRNFFATASAESGVRAPPMDWVLAKDLDDMQRGGVHTAMLSIFTPYDVGTAAQRTTLARGINEAGARLAGDHPGAFGQFATLPLPDLDASLGELAYAFDVLHADGITLYSNLGDKWLRHPYFRPLLEELDRRAAVVFVHPTTAACCRGLVADVPDPVVEFGTDTTRTIASLIFSGAAGRFPRIRFIFSHGGGTMPFLIERFLGGMSAQLLPGVETRGQPAPYVPHQPEGGALAAIRRMYFDTAQCANPVAMKALRGVVPASQILFGTDYFYRSAADTARGLVTSQAFNHLELRAIEFGNAAALFPRFA
jgi:6-methylsalicylate decarboxylase